MKLKPLADKIVVQRIESKNKTDGGIYLPDSAKEKPQEGKVISVGNGRVLENGTIQKLEVKKGDTILFSKNAGTEIKVDNVDYLILNESSVMAIIKND